MTLPEISKTADRPDKPAPPLTSSVGMYTLSYSFKTVNIMCPDNKTMLKGFKAGVSKPQFGG